MKKEKSPHFISCWVFSLLAQGHNALMRSKTTRAAIVCASCAGIFITTANAQPDITWQTPVTISDPSDVSTLGIYFGSWAPHGSTLAVNGVTFQAFSDLPGFGTSFDNSTGSGSFASPATSDANYNTLLTSGAFGNTEGSYTVNWSGMTPGNTYLVELWVNDGRNSVTAERTETITGGANTSAALAYGTGPSGTGPGQYIVGTFVADSTGTETLTLNALGGPDIGASAQLNLLQVRDTTPKPNVTWQTPVTISGTSDVSTLGAYFGSWAPQDGSANTFPVNGITFQGFSDLPFLTVGSSLDNGYNGFVSTTSDGNYNTLLQYARFSNETTPATFSWSGMRPGNTYLIQFWVNDGRNIGQSRTETITGGASTSALLSYGSDGSGLGQYVIGTFVANSSGGQTLTLTASSTGANPSAQVNLFQVRDITPPRITGVAVSGTTLTITATNCPTKGAYVLLQNANVTLPLAQWTPVFTNSFDGSGGINLSTNVVNPSNPWEFYILRSQ